ncbi:GNAT family N-acetyltransferase [Rhodanobacter sp. Col0626]|uniref:GNAT family N-acetyltransferase n=1 Tax=Rhodanobacter sp. Col0626 TaxID=3415679 RepID=UPI003CEC4A40
MNRAIGIRYVLARPQDARAIGVLVRRVARRWILPEQPACAAEALLRGMHASAIRHKILAGQRFHLAWRDDGRLAGVAAMREDCHLFQFFVSTRLHGHGIARRLWQRTMRDAVRRANTRRFTLNASAMAEPVYRRFGFVPDGPLRFNGSGLIVQPMRLDLP